MAIKTRVIFVRHAEAEGNFNRVFHGWTDSCITEKGHLQAQRVAERLKDVDIDVIYSSSLKRTLQTAQYIADVKNLPIIRTDKLKEINGGEWENKGWAELPHLWPEEYDSWENRPHEHKMPGGETMVEFQKRLIDEVEYILSNNKGKNICVVTHGTAIRSMMCYFKGCDLTEMINIQWHDNTSVTVLDYEDGKFDIVLEGDISHLGKELCTVLNQEWWQEYNEKYEKRKQKESI
ncbi:histidine phosphatase family protein [Acetivibrio mesophilus]|uniref:Histidine phosphatase family protein n=1 Tax=Acetivibrio mesophilus TaxID=2487273 RepID=A0A4Q0I5Y3_9FIRM|nr:histidine phosphatase family protein [Acetivibrio mesophilus]ODM25206.1 phosphoglycerate mutase [Clostridium sp. Bc-iso-3]RXE59776.1 histidine phosphatase family protein [Acetivibrio mesophilus]HHV29302.1 histidine phosphatase family protein [Clostridium sp.]